MSGISPCSNFFIRQESDYSCGPACLATVARIYGIDHGYTFFKTLLDPCPVEGTRNSKMVEAAQKYLPYEAHGEDIYVSGIAIANIIHPQSNEGHYIVMLGRRGNEIIYYDPWDHEVMVFYRHDITWESETGHRQNWSINFSPLPNLTFEYWEGRAQENP